uniref:Uncharacterized protein n=1 Tax=Odontella aurita TaxID=265563 RepID=A0A7S4J4I8_9STRA|mmetsp:Transcript_38269/g.114581  ORF Transcript_38269/g.114581 Transcript_38269/m.114581 type:complete len:110 (+) Transcript_38269:846-1175(+)
MAYLEEQGVSTANATTDHLREARRQGREKYLAVALLYAADRSCAGGPLLKEMNNDALKGLNTYPSSVAKSLGMINDYLAAASTPKIFNDSEGVAFAQEEEISLAQTGKK